MVWGYSQDSFFPHMDINCCSIICWKWFPFPLELHWSFHHISIGPIRVNLLLDAIFCYIICLSNHVAIPYWSNHCSILAILEIKLCRSISTAYLLHACVDSSSLFILLLSCSVTSSSLRPHGLQYTRLYWDIIIAFN